MQFTQETGNNLLLEWYADNIKSVELEGRYFIDYAATCQVLIGFDGNRKVNTCKVYNNFHDFSLGVFSHTIIRDKSLEINPFIFNDIDKQMTVEVILDNNETKMNAVAILLKSLDYISEFTGIIVSQSKAHYILLCLNRGSLLVQRVVSIDKIQDLYYLISAIRHSFLNGNGSLIIESSKGFYVDNLSFFENYFAEIIHWYKPISDFCIGMDTSNLVDVNCYLLDKLIHFK